MLGDFYALEKKQYACITKMCGAALNYSPLRTILSSSFLICKMGTLPWPLPGLPFG